MRCLRKDTGRRISNIIAATSMKRRFVGYMSGVMGSIPVGRAMDYARHGSGKVYLPDAGNDPTLLRGIETHFDTEAEAGGMVVLPTVNANAATATVGDIVGPEEIRLKRGFEGEDANNQLSGDGTKYKTAPKVDQSHVYEQVFGRLREGGAVCIFPEGGSHDRTELLPLKGEISSILQFTEQEELLTARHSWRCDHGSWITSREPRLRTENNSMWHELFPPQQVQVTRCSRIWLSI